MNKFRITWLALWAFTVMLLFVLSPLGVVLLLVCAIGFPIDLKSYHEKQRKIKWEIPTNSPKIQYFGGFAPLYKQLYFCYLTDTQKFTFWEALPNEKHGAPKKVEILKDNIIAFTKIGDLTQYTTTSGGGASLGGAVAGGMLFGAVGAVVGGRKKVHSTVHTNDNRKTVIKFSDAGTEKSMVVSYGAVYDTLAQYATEKLITA